MVLINETASRLANETSDMTNDGSLQQAEIIDSNWDSRCLRQHKRRSKTGTRD